MIPQILAGIGTAGSIVQAGISMAKKPTYPGPSADEEQALFLAGETAADASMLGEASAAQVSRMVQTGNEVDSNQIQEFNAMFRNVSPFDMAKISQSLIKRSLDVRKQTGEGIASFLDSSQSKNLLTRVSANQGYAQIANVVQQKKLQAQLLKEDTEARMNKQFTDMMTNITKAISSPILDIGAKTDMSPGITTSNPNAAAQVQPVPAAAPTQPVANESDVLAKLQTAGFSQEQIEYFMNSLRSPGYAGAIASPPSF